MLHRINISILLVLSSIPFLYPQTIRNIEVSGNNFFSASEIIGWSGISSGQNIFPGIIDSVNSRLAFNFAVSGYYHSSFNTELQFQPDSQTANLDISLIENDPTYIFKIIFTNAASVDSASFLNLSFLKVQFLINGILKGR